MGLMTDKEGVLRETEHHFDGDQNANGGRL